MSSPSLQFQRLQSRASKPVLTSSRPGIAGLDSLDELIAAIARLQEKAIEELRERRARLRRELSSVDADLAELTGETGETAPARPDASSEKRLLTLSELIAELQAAPGRTLNIRKANLEVKTIKAMARAHPHLLKLGGKTGWPTVTLLDRPKQKPTGAKPEEPHPELFD